MIKKGGLGTIPKGLEWIVNKSEPKIDLEHQAPKEQESENTLPQSAPAPNEAVLQTHEEALPAKEHFTSFKENAHKAALVGLPPGFTRATFIIKQEHIDRLKALAFVRKMAIKDVVDEIMISFLKDTDVESILLEALRKNAKQETRAQ